MKTKMSTEPTANCPICCKEFALEAIESHVNKCIFLNSNVEPNLKRFQDEEVNGTTSLAAFSPPKRARTTKSSDDSFSPGSFKIKNETETKDSDGYRPLAEKMRPRNLEDYIGQNHILGSNSTLRNLLEKNNVPSMILWGPPGCGKTTLAHIIHSRCQEKREVRFVKLSATLAGVNDVKEIVQVAKNELKMFKRKTILFMDEIHRFNKLQQDIFLPNVESGVITLIGATTENPSFSLNSALLSRCRVFVLEKLKADEVASILMRAVKSLNVEVMDKTLSKGSSISSKYQIEAESLKYLADMCDGDARIALNSLQLALDSSMDKHMPKKITHEDIINGIKRSHLLYDRKGEEHYNIISALHKSIRASDDNAALYWLARMLEGGQDPIFIARRLVRAASEDIGMADPMALTMAVSAMQGCQLIGMPECDVLLAQTAVYLARAKKSTEVYKALLKAKECIKTHKGPLPSVPLHLRNAPTKLMKDLGYARGYNMKHKDESNLKYMPEGLESTSFFFGR